MLQWLEQELKVSSSAFRKLKAAPAKLQALRPRPTLAVAQANVAALKDVLYMSTPQVRPTAFCFDTSCTQRSGVCIDCTPPPYVASVVQTCSRERCHHMGSSPCNLEPA